jgi:hypothetical protein
LRIEDAIRQKALFEPGFVAGDVFDHFAIVAQRTNVYTVRDYASIIEHPVRTWDIAGRAVTGEAARAQEELCRQAERHVRLAERTAAALAKQPPRAFSWIRDRLVRVGMTDERIRLGISACLLGELVRFDGDAIRVVNGGGTWVSPPEA